MSAVVGSESCNPCFAARDGYTSGVAIHSCASCRVAPLDGGRPDDTAKSQMTSRGVDLLRHARGRSIAPAVVRRAKIRAALHHLARNRQLLPARVDAGVALGAARIVERAACV